MHRSASLRAASHPGKVDRAMVDFTRRTILQLVAGATPFAALPVFAGQARIDKLIVDAQTQSGMSQRIDFISRALLGTGYEPYTLIGGPRRPEKFVVRDDVFDCVTFCETVLAGAMSVSYTHLTLPTIY